MRCVSSSFLFFDTLLELCKMLKLESEIRLPAALVSQYEPEFLIQLPANVLGPLPPKWGNSDEAPGPAPAVTPIWGVNQQMKTLSFSFFFCGSVTLPLK